MKTRFHCRGCGTVVTETTRKAALMWWCKCGKQDYVAGVAVVPVLPTDPKHEQLVDELVNKAIAANNRKGPGRPPGPPTDTVSFRVLASDLEKAVKKARKAGYETVSAWVKAMFEREVGR